MPRGDISAEQVTVLPQHVAVTRERGGLAIVHDAKAGRSTQIAAHGLAQCCQSLGVGACDGEQDQPRYHSLSQLVDQDLLRRIGRAGQEGRHVGTEPRVDDDGTANEQPGPPNRDDAKTICSRWGSGVTSMSVRSPSSCNVRISRIVSRWPWMRIDATISRNFASLGSKVRVQASE